MPYTGAHSRTTPEFAIHLPVRLDLSRENERYRQMRTIYVEKNLPRMLAVRTLRGIWSGVVFSPISPARLVELPEPQLPGPRWVRVRNRLGGVCGSDLALLFVRVALSVSHAALPGTDRIYLGHEAIGQVTEVGPQVTMLKVGDRVIIDSEAPCCLTREIVPPCRHCREGNHLLCENTSVDQGAVGVGGGWGDIFIAHETGVYRVPDGLDDDAAVLVEPLAVGVRAALRRLPEREERALVVGCGTIGLGVVGAVRALSPLCHITAFARYPQQVEMARRLGADEVIAHEDPYLATARITGGKLYTGMFNNRTILGGFDVVYDCVGKGTSLSNSLRWARAGGTVVLVGAPMEPVHVDLTPTWLQEVDLIGLYAHGGEEWNGVSQSTYDLTTGLLLEGKLAIAGIITHRFPLEEWRSAVRTATDKRSSAIKVVFHYPR